MDHLPTELKLEIFDELIFHDAPLDSLTTLAQTSRDFHAIYIAHRKRLLTTALSILLQKSIYSKLVFTLAAAPIFTAPSQIREEFLSRMPNLPDWATAEPYTSSSSHSNSERFLSYCVYLLAQTFKLATLCREGRSLTLGFRPTDEPPESFRDSQGMMEMFHERRRLHLNVNTWVAVVLLQAFYRKTQGPRDLASTMFLGSNSPLASGIRQLPQIPMIPALRSRKEIAESRRRYQILESVLETAIDSGVKDEEGYLQNKLRVFQTVLMISRGRDMAFEMASSFGKEKLYEEFLRKVDSVDIYTSS